jgi:hypothetical protein
MGASRTGVRGLAGGRHSGWRRAGWAVAAVAGLVLAGLAPVSASAAQTPSGCAAAAVGQISCGALVTPGSTTLPASAVRPAAGPSASASAAAALPPGLTPLNLRNAYGLDDSSLTGGVGQTVAVVTEYGDPDAESDMATYRSEFSLPACGTGCFSVVDENGGTDYPPAGPGWSLATAESLDVISAICPNCHILLVEAGITTDGSTTVGISDLGAAENTAVSEGAKFITNTWFTPEATFGTSEPTYDGDYFNHPGVAITAPDGDGAGYGTYYPAASPDVIAVGGTTLTADNSTARGWSETVWSGTGSGCSPYEAKPSWQTDTGCTTRMLNDVSAVADPTNSGLAIFDTPTAGGWSEDGGTDVASALVAAAYALAGTPAAGSYPASYLYAHDGAAQVNDITSGNDGTCTPSYYCTAGTGYDGPSGVGSIASATALGATAPDATLAGIPAVSDPENGSLDVFGTGNANGTGWGDSWTSSGGWSGWSNLSGTLSGIPASAIYDPINGNLEVYGLGENGDVYEDYTSNGSAWSGWQNLGGTFAGSPDAVFNPADDSVDVWEVGTTGTAFEDSWKLGSGWSGWQNKSGALGSAGLAAVYDPITATMYVFGAGSGNGTVWGGSYTSSGAFSGWSNMNGEMTGKLSAVFDPMNHNIEIYGEDSSGFTEESYSTNNGSSWSNWSELPTAGTAMNYPPTAVYSPLGNSIEVWATGTGPGTTFDDSWTPSGGWSGWTNRSGALGSGLAPIFDPYSGDLRIFGVGNGNGTVWGAALTPSGSWEAWGNMSGTLQTGDMS